MIDVVVVDDQSMVRGALVALLGLEADLKVVGEAASGQECLDLLEHLGAGERVVLMDVEMPGMDGIAATAEITARFPEVKVFMVTTFGKPGYVNRALKAGAQGFLVKDAPPAQLTAGIRAAAAGERVIDPQLAVESVTQGDSPLSERETEVMREALTGATVEDIAAKLHLSAGTVRNHISAAMAKTDAQTRAEAARRAQELGWL